MKYRDNEGNLHDFNVIKGESCYESAVTSGYTGTEEQFYSSLSKIDSFDTDQSDINFTDMQDNRFLERQFKNFKTYAELKSTELEDAVVEITNKNSIDLEDCFEEETGIIDFDAWGV